MDVVMQATDNLLILFEGNDDLCVTYALLLRLPTYLLWDVNEKIIFYTALFQSAIFISAFSEYGKYYSNFDDKKYNGNCATEWQRN